MSKPPNTYKTYFKNFLCESEALIVFLLNENTINSKIKEK